MKLLIHSQTSKVLTTFNHAGGSLNLCKGQCQKYPNNPVFSIFTRGQFWPSGIVVACVCLSVCVSVCVCVRQPRACPRHKSPRVQARTTKFGQKVQNNLVKVPIVLGGDWPWPSRWNLTWKAKFTPFWACSRHNSSSIEARTTKFGQ